MDTDTYVIIKDIILFACIPCFLFMLKMWMNQVKLEERQKSMGGQISHNYKNTNMAIEHLNKTVDEIQKDIKELLKIVHN